MASAEYEAYYAVIRRVPAGRVVTYGDVAHYAGRRGQARRVGYALYALTDQRVPWWRVVNARGEVSLRNADGGAGRRQRALLEAEGVAFDAGGRIDLGRYRYRPAECDPDNQEGTR